MEDVTGVTVSPSHRKHLWPWAGLFFESMFCRMSGKQKIITSPMRHVTVRIDSGEDSGLFLEARLWGDGEGGGGRDFCHSLLSL